jgi:hypothetical protein
MNGLQANINGQQLVFTPDGNVSATSGGASQVKGTWKTKAADQASQNKISYTIGGAPQTPVPVTYQFNANNQLVAVIPAAANGGAASAPFTFLGTIAIDDNHDVTYSLLNATGAALPTSITVYGDISFEANTNDLLIKLAGGGQTKITGEDGVQKLEALENTLAGFNADDLLRFIASTTNTFADGTVTLAAAKIDFIGNWDVKGDQLVFMSRVKGNIANPDVEIGFGGTFKGVTFGFAYFSDKDGVDLAFNIKGQHTWNSTAVSWNVSLGYTQKTFKASFAGTLHQKSAEGREFTLSGKTTFEMKDGSKPSFALELNGEYDWTQDGKLIFTAKVSEQNGALNYDLSLEGKFVFKSGTLSFQIKVSSADSSPSVQITLAFQGNQASLIKALSLVLNVSEGQVSIDFQFEMRMTFVDGVLVKSAPQEIAA